jgi:hypothetical protein
MATPSLMPMAPSTAMKAAPAFRSKLFRQAPCSFPSKRSRIFRADSRGDDTLSSSAPMVRSPASSGLISPVVMAPPASLA